MDQFYVSQNGKVCELVIKVINVIDPQKEGSQDGNSGGRNPAFAAQNNGFGQRSESASAFGPSRFQASPYSQPSYQTRNPANYGGQPFQNAAFRSGSAAPSNSPKMPRPFRPKDWMPWSLIAAGVIITLYTKASAGGSTNHDD
ncbi:MAG: hypothetical protein AAFN77_14285 [Planctomycetota bacterium]